MTHFDYLFVDFMVQAHHRKYCNALINALNQGHSSLVITKEGYIDYKSEDKHRIITIKTKEVAGNYPFRARYNTYYNYKSTLEEIKGYAFDKIVVLGYDPVMFSFMYKKLMSLGNVYLVEHHQLDEVDQSNWKNWIWSTYKDQVNHIVLDESVVMPVSEIFDIPKGKIHVFPLPCIIKPHCIKTNANKTKLLCISNSNDVIQMRDLVDYERKTSIFEKNNIEIIIRKMDGVDTTGIKSLKVIDGYLSDGDYNTLYNECDIVLMPFSAKFKFRCSGTLNDAICAGKKVISSEILESKAYEQLFPEICKTYTDVKTICDIVMGFGIVDLDVVQKKFFEYQELSRTKGIRSIGE